MTSNGSHVLTSALSRVYTMQWRLLAPCAEEPAHGVRFSNEIASGLAKRESSVHQDENSSPYCSPGLKDLCGS